MPSTESPPQKNPSSIFSQVLYYTGAVLVISSMIELVLFNWESIGGGGLVALAVIYGLICAFIGHKLWYRPDFHFASGLLFVMALCMVPLAVYGLQVLYEWWPADSNDFSYELTRQYRINWIIIFVPTLIAGLLLLYFYPFPLLLIPIYASLWFLIAHLWGLWGNPNVTINIGAWLAMAYSIIPLLAGYYYDRKELYSFGFWSYLVGTLTFWFSLNSLVWDKGHGTLFIYFLVNIALIGAYILLKRKVLMICGAIGCFLYASYIAYMLFDQSVSYLFILSFVGFLLIFIAVFHNKQRNNP